MRFLALIVTSLSVTYSYSQTQDSNGVTAPILLAKMEFLSHTNIKPEKFGRSAYSYNPTYFMDTRLKLNNRRYQHIGLLYLKLEKYCKFGAINYNKHELQVYRRNTVFAGSLFGIASFGFLPVYFYAQDYSARTGYSTWPGVLFRGKLAPILWALPVAASIAACKIKGSAERKLKNRVFLNDAYEK